MKSAYNALIVILFPLVVLRLFWRGLRNRGYRLRWGERFGYYSAQPRLLRPLWIHAVSVGEVNAAAPLIKAIKEHHLSLQVLVTTTTLTGYETLNRLLGHSVHHVYFPYDLPVIVRRFLEHFNPRALVLMETELWPNLLEQCHGMGMPIYLVNARMSERSARRYLMFRRLTRSMFEAIEHIAVQGGGDRTRFLQLGAEEARITVTGSLKFDVSFPPSIREEGAALRRELGINRPILMAGSTRLGEEEILLEAMALVCRRFPDLLLIIAPRHPERFEAVADLCRRLDLETVNRKSGRAVSLGTQVFLLDTMGELLKFYAASDIAFVGGSLIPAGGHNVLEPAGIGIPVITGPHMFNFFEISDMLQASGALKIVNSVAEIEHTVNAWLSDSNARDIAGRMGQATVENNRGATRRIMRLLANRVFES